MTRWNAPALFILTLFLPAAALPDISGLPTLNFGQNLSLDTGAVSASGGDISISATGITFQGSAIGYNVSLFFGLSGGLGFDVVESSGQSFVQSFASLFSNAPITSGIFGGFLVGNIFLAETNGGNYSIVLINAINNNSVVLQFYTFGASTPAGPYITLVMNNYSLIPSGFANSGIAQGSLFIIQGSGLASAATAALQSSAAGLPTTLNGATVSITAGGNTIQPVFYYAMASQLALVMPSGTPVGPAIVTVSYNGQTSPPYTIEVSQSTLGFASYNGTGGGLGLATDAASGALYTFSNVIAPGATINLWGSGLGADPAADSTYAPGAFSINGLAALYIGGVQAQIQYQGASGFPGLNQLNVIVPSNVPTGCFVPVIGVSATGVPTNEIVLPIGNGGCEDPLLTGAIPGPGQLFGQQNVNLGSVQISYTSEPSTTSSTPQVTTSAYANFDSVPGAALESNPNSVSANSCSMVQYPTNFTVPPVTNGLNAGAITVNGPNSLSPVTMSRIATTVPGFYDATLPDGFLTTSGGTFTFNGTQGTQVGAFTAQVVFPTPLLDWTNQDSVSTVTRSAGMPITWTGGAPGTIVTISGTSWAPSAVANFLCAAPAEAGQFTVPSYILAGLPAGGGSVNVGNQTVPQLFTATGIDYGATVGLVGFTTGVIYQ